MSEPLVHDPAPLTYARFPDRAAPPGTLAVTAVAFGALSLAFLPFGPVALTLGIVCLTRRQGLTPQGRSLGVLAIIFGGLSTAALLLLALWLYSLAHVGPFGRRP